MRCVVWRVMVQRQFEQSPDNGAIMQFGEQNLKQGRRGKPCCGRQRVTCVPIASTMSSRNLSVGILTRVEHRLKGVVESKPFLEAPVVVLRMVPVLL